MRRNREEGRDIRGDQVTTLLFTEPELMYVLAINKKRREKRKEKNTPADANRDDQIHHHI